MIVLSEHEAKFMARVAYAAESAHLRSRGAQPKPYRDLDDHELSLLESQVLVWDSDAPQNQNDGAMGVFDATVKAQFDAREAFVDVVVQQASAELQAQAEAAAAEPVRAAEEPEPARNNNRRGRQGIPPPAPAAVEAVTGNVAESSAVLVATAGDGTVTEVP